MKKIEAIIKPCQLPSIKDALIGLGIDELTTVEAKGFGRQARHAGTYRGSEYVVESVPKVKLELVVNDRELGPALAAITGAGDERGNQVFVSDVAPVRRMHAEALPAIA